MQKNILVRVENVENGEGYLEVIDDNTGKILLSGKIKIDYLSSPVTIVIEENNIEIR